MIKKIRSSATGPHDAPSRIHKSGDSSRLDRLLELLAVVATPRPLMAALDQLPERVGSVFAAEVCSIYLLESDRLVLRGNVGFPVDALPDITLCVGEGITGQAVQLGRPISLTNAPQQPGYRYFAELGEALPFFLATPIVGAAGPLGALVLQRSEARFAPRDVELAVALTAPIAAAVEQAKLIEGLSGQGRRISHSTRRVTLSGRAAIRGRAVGRMQLAPRPGDDLPGPTGDEAATLLETVKQDLRRQIETLQQRAPTLHADPAPLAALLQMLEDARAWERVLELSRERSVPLPRALCTAGGEALRAATRTQDAFNIERAAALSDLCETLAMLAAKAPSGALPRTPVVAADRLSLHDVLLASRLQPAAVVLRERRTGKLDELLLRLLDVPAVAGVAALFRWTDEGDLLLVDAEHGLVRVNPSRAEVALARDARRRDRPRDPADQAKGPSEGVARDPFERKFGQRRRDDRDDRED